MISRCWNSPPRVAEAGLTEARGQVMTPGGLLQSWDKTFQASVDGPEFVWVGVFRSSGLPELTGLRESGWMKKGP